MRWIISGLLAISTAAGIPARTSAQMISAGDTITVPDGDVHMANAIRQARARLPEFLALARNPDPSMRTFAVKVAIPTDKGGAEYIWITPFEIRDDHFVGRISNEPRGIQGLRQGQLVGFESDNIVDWTYHQNGKRKGNFTARAVAKRLVPEEAKLFIERMKFDKDP